MLYTEEAVKANIRNRDGQRVFYLGEQDRLTPGARDYLNAQRIKILPAQQARPDHYRLPGGGVLTEKPEYMTHLHSDVLVDKTHPRIAFRGAVDTLEAELLTCQAQMPPDIAPRVGELLSLARELIACEVLSREVKWERLLGMTEAELRSRSHRPQDYYGIAHFMPEAADGMVILLLNRCRCAIRSAELAAARAFRDMDGGCTRGDILRALNRMSSGAYLLMLQEKAKRR